MQENSRAFTTEGIVSYDRFLDNMGRSQVTGWRWRQRGWLHTVNIAGRLYLEAAEIDRFLNRARRGEFERPIGCPKRQIKRGTSPLLQNKTAASTKTKKQTGELS
jgi:hypothetical protein